ncbi:AAA family ATPase [Pseudomonas baetica]|uniref:AAA family ATPase n=1 Tax=Pseudomonas baetica TaxID=674054 RepID=UPI002405AA57|nr:ATP-binding protein [Pseudomonas baetica]MDF9778788.1 SpoVK/Ycf46/Vps4 family AAA+-type ATPase [Pseudomonas baetica]
MIKLLPALIQAAIYRNQREMISVSTQLVAATEGTHPRVHEQLKRLLRSQNTAVPFKEPPQKMAHIGMPTIALDDVVLEDHLEAEVHELLLEHHRRAELQAFSLEPRHKILLEGAEGNGKTMLAEALAHSLEVLFIQVKFSGVISSRMGETGQFLDEIFQYAAGQPCVLFIDEFDTIATQRGSNAMDVGEAQRITNQLLLSLNKLPAHTVFIAATNNLGAIDRAARRRFDCEMSLGKPSQALREKLASKELSPTLTPGSDLSKWVAPVAALELGNLDALVKLCRRLRRDQALYQGAGIQSIISRAQAPLLPA